MARVPRRCGNPDCRIIFWALGPEEHCALCQELIDALGDTRVLRRPKNAEPLPSGLSMRQLIESIKSPRGGFTRAGLKKLGVPWPPPKGWRRKLMRADRPVDIKPLLDGRERRARALGGWYRDREPTARYKEHALHEAPHTEKPKDGGPVSEMRWTTGWYKITDEGTPLSCTAQNP